MKTSCKLLNVVVYKNNQEKSVLIILFLLYCDLTIFTYHKNFDKFYIHFYKHSRNASWDNVDINNLLGNG